MNKNYEKWLEEVDILLLKEIRIRAIHCSAPHKEAFEDGLTPREHVEDIIYE